MPLVIAGRHHPERAMTRQCIIAAIVGLILITSLGIGGFPPAIALALTFTGATVILMMGCTGWPREGITLSDTDWTGELDALINLARLRGYYVRTAADGIFEVEESSPAVAFAMAPQRRCAGGCGRIPARRQIMTTGIFETVERFQIDGISAKPMTMKDRELSH